MMRLLIAFLIVAGSLDAQQFWGKTTYGMSREDVVAAFPHAIVPKDQTPDRYGTVESLMIPKVDFHGQPFSVHFYFNDDRLMSVSLLQEGERDWEAKRRTFDALTADFRKEIGPEAKNDFDGEQDIPVGSPGHVVGTAHAIMHTWFSGTTWVGRTTWIEMTLAQIKGSDTVRLNVTYQLTRRVDRPAKPETRASNTR